MAFLGKDIAVGEQAEAGEGELDAAREMPGPNLDVRVLSGGDAALEEGLAKALSAAGGAKEDECLPDRLLEVFAKLL